MMINLKRFNTYRDIDYDMTRLRNKIFDIFKFNSKVHVSLTYTDEDGHIIELDDNNVMYCNY